MGLQKNEYIDMTFTRGLDFQQTMKTAIECLQDSANYLFRHGFFDAELGRTRVWQVVRTTDDGLSVHAGR